MASAIDDTKPIAGTPTTQSVRDNFTVAKSEITGLQTADTARVLKAGDTMSGLLTVPQVSVGAGAGRMFEVVGPGLTVSDAIVVIRNNHNTVGDNTMYIGAGSNASDTSSVLINFVDGSLSAVQGTIKRNGAGAVAYNTTSDARLKEHVADSKTGLDVLMKLKVRDFNFKREPGRTQQGLVAQELAEIYPIAVSSGGDDPVMEPWGIDYGRLTPLLIRAIQQLLDRVAALERHR